MTQKKILAKRMSKQKDLLMVEKSTEHYNVTLISYLPFLLKIHIDMALLVGDL